MNKYTRIFENLTMISQVGISMVVPIVLGVYIGKILDSKLDSSPLFLFIFIIVGIGTAFSSLFKVAVRSIDSTKRK